MKARYVTPFLLTVSSAAALAQASPAASAAATATPAAATATSTKAHICLAPSSVETVGGTAADAITAVRETFTSYLTGPTLEVAPLTSRLPSQAREEAKSANCPYLLLTTVKQERKTSGGGPSLLSRVASTAAQQGAYSVGMATGSTAGRVAADAAGGAAGAAATNYGSAMQTKDELTLITHLETADGKALVDMSDKKKAESNGQDLLTPLVEKAASAVASAVAKPGK